MAKRFTDTDIWDKEWFMKLSPKHKCLIRFIFDKCDVAGIWTPNWALASLYIGQKCDQGDLSAIKNQVVKLDDGKFFVPDFISFQYGTLSENCKPHIKVIQTLKKHGLFERVLEGYTTASESLEEKEEDKEKDKDQEEDKGGPGENYYRVIKHLKLTFEGFGKLLDEGWTKEQIDHILDQIENYSGNKKYTVLLTTARNWLKKDAKGGKNPMQNTATAYNNVLNEYQNG